MNHWLIIIPGNSSVPLDNYELMEVLYLCQIYCISHWAPFTASMLWHMLLVWSQNILDSSNISVSPLSYVRHYVTCKWLYSGCIGVVQEGWQVMNNHMKAHAVLLLYFSCVNAILLLNLWCNIYLTVFVWLQISIDVCWNGIACYAFLVDPRM